MGRWAVLLLTFALMTTGAKAQASEDLKCFSAALDMSKLAANTDSKYAFLPLQGFYLGRLSVIEPKTDWIWVAGSEKHVGLPEARLIIEQCANRESRLTHVSQ